MSSWLYYYNRVIEPLAVQFADSFDVSYSQVSKFVSCVTGRPLVNTALIESPLWCRPGTSTDCIEKIELIVCRYAVGLLLISPLGDLIRRRQLILTIIAIAASLTIGLSITENLIVFEALTFLVGVVSVTPMVLLPLAADLAPPERRASAIAVVLSGLTFGILVARVLAGVIAEFISWRVVYFMAIGVQYLVLLGCYLLIPDYPSKSKDLTYWNILWTMGKYSVTEPLVIQASLVNLASSACYTNFWVTLTFLLTGPPYHYSTYVYFPIVVPRTFKYVFKKNCSLVIGLFGLVGMLGVVLGPLVGRLVDHLVPWHASIISVVLLGAFQVIQVGAGGIHISAVIIVAFALDVFRRMLQVSLTTSVFACVAMLLALFKTLTF